MSNEADRLAGTIRSVDRHVVAPGCAQPVHVPRVDPLDGGGREQHEPDVGPSAGKRPRGAFLLDDAAAHEPVAMVDPAGERPAPTHAQTVALARPRAPLARTRRPSSGPSRRTPRPRHRREVGGRALRWWRPPPRTRRRRRRPAPAPPRSPPASAGAPRHRPASAGPAGGTSRRSPARPPARARAFGRARPGRRAREPAGPAPARPRSEKPAARPFAPAPRQDRTPAPGGGRSRASARSPNL